MFMRSATKAVNASGIIGMGRSSFRLDSKMSGAAFLLSGNQRKESSKMIITNPSNDRSRVSRMSSHKSLTSNSGSNADVHVSPAG